MEKYPGELLVGVFPLVFCVDATLQKENESNLNSNEGQGGAATRGNNHEQQQQSQPRSPSMSNRSQFDKFLDAMAASLMDDSADEYNNQARNDFPGGVVPQRTRSYDSSEVGGQQPSSMAHPLSMGSGDHPAIHGGSNNNNPLTSLFRGDESDEYDSDMEDDLILGSSTPTTARNPDGRGGDGSNISGNETYDNHNPFLTGGNRRGSRTRQNRPSLPKIGLPRMGSHDNRNNLGRPSSSGASGTGGGASSSGNVSFDTSFSQALQQGQSFFQRARIVSISSRHGFPPSKDPSGQRNRMKAYFGSQPSSGSGISIKTSNLLAATQKRPIDGILPSGWLEKHAAALPSAILVVIQVDEDTITQSDQDQILLETLENLQHSLAPKRQVLIQVVGLVQEGTSSTASAQWSHTMANKLASLSNDQHKLLVGVGGTGGVDSPPQPVILLPVSDLQPDASYSAVMHQLHERVRNASFEYYWNRCKDVKQKLCQLGPSRRTPLLLPLSIRYCVKVSFFYEFQWKQEKSLKYMLEAYRLLETYYRYLLQQREVADDSNEFDTAKARDGNQSERTFSHTTAAISDEKDEGVELSITTVDTTEDSSMFLFSTSPPTEDMVYQCRAVADWLNFKILQQGLMSNTEAGIIAASNQIQRHAQAFCSYRHSFICPQYVPWLDWAFVSQQWLVVSQLLERHPPRVLGDLGGVHDEELLRCSAWRCYESAASSMLRTAHLLYTHKDVNPEKLHLGPSSSAGKKDDIVRTRYVGGIDHEEGFVSILEDELKFDHKSQALSCLTRGLSLLEKENQHLSENTKLQIWSRASARLHYLAGGALFSMDEYSEAMKHLCKATRLCLNWAGLETSTRRLLVECFRKIPIDSFSSDDKLMVSPILMDSILLRTTQDEEILSVLNKISVLSGAENKELEWQKECTDESDETLPFSFSVTFPSITHATAGEQVQVHLWLRSNIAAKARIDKISLHSSIGNIDIPALDLINGAPKSSEGSSSLVMDPHNSVEIVTQISLPVDVCEVGIQEASSGSDNKPTEAKSYSKSARPRTSGITAAAGARFLSEDLIESSDVRPQHSQWSQKCLGGKSLSCDGIDISFQPLVSKDPSSSASPLASVNLTIRKVEPKRDVQVKRTPFEEENYIASAWKRPFDVPLSRGPRCLRALNPSANMTMINVTDAHTNGRALEGTVNRVVLKLTAGPQDHCKDIKIWIKSSSMLIGADSTTKSIAIIGDDNLLLDNAVDMMNPRVRAPVLVVPNSASTLKPCVLGYNLPRGWDLFGENGHGDEAYKLTVQNIKSGESAYIFLDVFRPTPSPTHVEGIQNDESSEVDFDKRMCRTNLEVSVTYDQSHDIGTASDEQHSELESSTVTLFDTMSLLWSAPISAHFSPTWKDAFPSGNRHPTNFVSDAVGGRTRAQEPVQEMVLIDKERVTTRCVMEAIASADGLEVEIENVKFENSSDQNAPCSFDLLSGLEGEEDGVVYRGAEGDVGRRLGVGSKFVVCWTASVNMQSAYLKGSVTSTLGELSVYWRPPAMELPVDVTLYDENSNLIRHHGPLHMSDLSCCKFEGPPCYIENSPFEACAERIPDTIRQSHPFDVAYSITNKTSLDQQLDVRLMPSDASIDASRKAESGFLVSGLTSGMVDLGPYEKYTISFTVIPTRVGEVALPKLTVASTRYKTWVIQENTKSVFVIP